MQFQIDIEGATKHNFNDEDFQKDLELFLRGKLHYWNFDIEKYDFSKDEVE